MMMADHAGLKLHVSHASAVERSMVVSKVDHFEKVLQL